MTTFWTVDGHPALQNGQLIVNMIDPCDLSEVAAGCSSVYLCCCPNAYDTELAAICPDKPCKLKIRITRAQPLRQDYMKYVTEDWQTWSAANCPDLNGTWELTKQNHSPWAYNIGTWQFPEWEYSPYCYTDTITQDVQCSFGGKTWWGWPASYNACCHGQWTIHDGVAHHQWAKEEATAEFKAWLEEEHEPGDLLALSLAIETSWSTFNDEVVLDGPRIAVQGYGVANYYTGEVYTFPDETEAQLIAQLPFYFFFTPHFANTTVCGEAIWSSICGEIGCIFENRGWSSPPVEGSLSWSCQFPITEVQPIRPCTCLQDADQFWNTVGNGCGWLLSEDLYNVMYGNPWSWLGVCGYGYSKGPWICIGDDCDDCKPPTTVPPFTPPDYVPPVAANPCGCCSWADAPPESIVITIGGAASGGDTCYDCSTKMNGSVICYLTEAGEGCTYTGFRAMNAFDCSRLCDDPVTVLKYTVQLSCFEEEEILYLSAAISIISVDSNGNYDGCFSVAFQGYGPTEDCLPADTPCPPRYSNEIHDCMEEGGKSLLQCIDECIENNEGDFSACLFGLSSLGGTSLPLDVYLYPYCSGLVNVGIQFNRQLCEEGNTPYWW